MKICWDNIEGMYLSNRGNLRKGGNTYIEKDSCKVCKQPYLTVKKYDSTTCSKSCGRKGAKFTATHLANMSKSQMGKKRSEETKLKISKATIGKLNPMFGKKHTQKVKNFISKRNYKGGFTKNGLSSYDTYSDQISWAEETNCVTISGTGYLGVKCVYCGKWYIPKSFEVRARKNSLMNNRTGGSKFYCSDECKENCPTYGKQKYPKGFKKGTSREVSTYLRKLCFERDNWECQKCGATENLHCHHINGYAQNKILANDIDNVITLCKSCHKKVHSKIGCRYVDLQCSKIKNKKE